ncbi:MAG: D-alanyl-D-alanine carboxypeptidase [Lachnospiraceae bacterium]|nr:D-alanyl-D-alanine carboxypeptidase [Lachnospiraceae bacterium]
MKKTAHNFFKGITFLILTAYCSCILSIPHPLIARDVPDGNVQDSDFLWPSGPSVFADAAIVMEVTTGLILYEKDIYTSYYPASITKVLTALMALENCSLNEIVTMSDAAEHNVYGSRIGLVSGEQVTLRDAMYGMLLESANEVSYAIGEHVAAKVNNNSGSMEEFSALMNARVKELGGVNSNFINPNGLHEQEHYTCAYDMALIGKEAIQYPDFRKIAGTRTYTIPPTNKNVARPLANHHRFIRKTLNYQYAIAGKTGGTTEALTTLITFAEKDGLLLVAVVLHVDTALHAYEDTINILNFAFENYSLYNIEDTELDLELGFPSLFSQTADFSSAREPLIHIGQNCNVVLPNSANFSDAVKSITYTPVEEFVHGDNVIGQISYQFAGKYIGFADIIYYNPDYPITRAEFEALWPSYMIPPDIVFKEENGSYTPITPEPGEDKENLSGEDKEGFHWLPVILGVTATIIILAIGWYLIRIELPHRRRHQIYKKKHEARLKSYGQQDDDQFNL